MRKFLKSADDKRESEKPLPSLHLFVSFLFIAARGAVVPLLDCSRQDGATKLSKRETYKKMWVHCADLLNAVSLYYRLLIQDDSKRWTQFHTSVFPELYMVCE